MHRTPTGKRVVITGRDIAIFRLLARYRYLNSTYIHAFAGGASVTRFKERLGDLFHEGFIDRPSQQWQFAEARCRATVYEIGDRAKRALREHERVVDERRDFLSQGAHRQFSHSLLICACLASAELAALSKPDVRFIPWSEILGRAPEMTRDVGGAFRIPLPDSAALIPDGLFGLEYKNDVRKSYRFFALEVDRGTMPVTRSNDRQTSCLAKLIAYREIIERQIHRSHLGVPNLLVLTATTSEERAAEIIRQFDRRCGGHLACLFKSLPHDSDILREPFADLLLGRWERSSHPPMSIA